MKEDLIMSLAENITIVMILCLVAGLLIGWYVTHQYHKMHAVKGGFVVTPTVPSPVPPPKRYLWQFINLANAGDNQTLNRSVAVLTGDGYDFQPDASNAGVLAFMKLEESIEAKGTNELTEEEILKRYIGSYEKD